MKKRCITILILTMLLGQNVSAAEQIEKEPVKVAEEAPATPAPDSDTGSYHKATEKVSGASAVIEFADAQASQPEEVAAWKTAVQEAAPDTSHMPKTLKDPTDGKEFSAYTQEGQLGFYYNKERFEISQTNHNAGTELVLRSKDPAESRAEMLIQFSDKAAQEHDTPESLAEYYMDLFADRLASQKQEEQNSESTEEINSSPEVHVKVQASDSNVLTYVLDQVPSIGVAEIGAQDIPSFSVLSNGISSFEEYYVIPTKDGCFNISLSAPVTETDKLDELYHILNSMLIENVDWDSETAMQLATKSFDSYMNKIS